MVVVVHCAMVRVCAFSTRECEQIFQSDIILGKDYYLSKLVIVCDGVFSGHQINIDMLD